MLRTRFVTDEDGQPFQQVLAPGGYALDVDVAQPQPVSADGLSEAIADVVGVDSTWPPRPLRARLLLDEDGSYVLVFIVHHVIGDGGSLAPLARDLVVAYAALAEGHEPAWAPLPVQYADFAVWQQSLLGDPADATSVAARQLRFWTDTLAGAPELLALPTDFPRPPMQTQRAQAFRFEVARETVAAIGAFARRNDASLFATLHAISAVVLARMTGERDIVIGTPYAGRGERRLDDPSGCSSTRSHCAPRSTRPAALRICCRWCAGRPQRPRQRRGAVRDGRRRSQSGAPHRPLADLPGSAGAAGGPRRDV